MTSWLLPLIGFSLAAVSFYQSGLFPKVKEEVCDTPACNYASTIIRNLMNTSVEPCDDFYEFVCGNRESVRSSQSIYKKYGPTGPQFTSLNDYILRDALASEPSPDDILPVRQIKKLYKSCIDLEARRSEGFQLILNEFKKMGGWNSNLTWQEIDRHYGDLLGLNAFYSFRIENQTLVIDDPKYVGVDPRWDLIRPAVANFTRLMNAELSSDELDALGKLRHEMVKNWKAYDTNYEKFKNTTQFLEWWKKSIDGVSKSNSSLANIDWMNILQRLSQETNLTLLNDTPIKYRKGTTADTFVHFYASLSELSKIIVNQVQWNFLLEMMPYVNLEGMENIMSTLENHKLLTKSRLTDCLFKDEPASAHLYRKKYNCWNGKAHTLYRNTLHALETRRSFGIELREEVSELSDSGVELTDYYKGLMIGNSYIENMFNLKRTRRMEKLSRLGKSVPRDMNSLIDRVPYSRLSSCDSSLPDYYGYGHSMFQVMSFDIYHARRYEAELARNLSRDYRHDCKFPAGPLGQGSIRVFDIWALEAAWEAYIKVKKEEFPYGEMKLPELTGFTDDQMFFISYAQGNCYGPSRVNDVLSSTNIFSEAFKCNNNSRMNPAEKCDAYKYDA